LADPKDQKPSGGKKLVDRIKDAIEGFVDDLKSLLDPPRPVRVPVTAGGRRR
jgi:hypothetical protein